MQILQKPSKVVEAALGQQTIDTTLNYRLLHYCLIVKYKDVVLLFNNLTKEFLSISDDESRFINEKSFKISNDFMVTLAKKWFLVPVNNDDVKLNNQIVLISRQLFRSDAITSYTILPTTACNARCFYCFEAGTKPLVMSEKTAQDVADFIIKSSKGNQVSISWFGGEPLCNCNAINVISDKLKSAATPYSSRMVSNGYLFDDSIIERALNVWKLHKVQITLDGTEKVYNRTKNYIYKGVNAFERVINNIGRLLKSDIAVTIRLNMDIHNTDDLFELVDYLANMYGNYKNFKIYPHLLFEGEGFEKIVHTDVERNLLGNDFINLCKYILNLGVWPFSSNLPNKTKIYQCMADSPNSIVIMPDGNLGRCEHYVDSKFIGNIYSEFDKSLWSDYVLLSDKCDICPSLPTCLKLKNCPDFNSGCCNYEQEEKILRLETQMKLHYDKWYSEGFVEVDDDVPIC